MAQDDIYIENPIDGRPLTRPPRSIFALILIIATGIVLSYWFAGKKDLRRHGIMTTAKITKWASSGDNEKVFEYVFSFDNKLYLNTKKYTDLSNVEADSLTNKHFPLLFISSYPDNNDILVTKTDFKKYKLALPDTLRVYDILFTD